MHNLKKWIYKTEDDTNKVKHELAKSMGLSIAGLRQMLVSHRKKMTSVQALGASKYFTEKMGYPVTVEDVTIYQEPQLSNKLGLYSTEVLKRKSKHQQRA